MQTKQNGRYRWILGLAISFLCLCLAFPAMARAPQGEITLAVVNGFEITGGDPLTTRGGNAMLLKNLLYDSLVIKKADGKIYPALATSWEIAKDWSYIKFVLNEKARFHNGDPVTAEDVKFTIERAQKPELKFSYRAELERHISKVEVLGTHSVKIHLTGPFPAFFDRCAEYLGVVPKKYIEKVGDAGFASKPVGAGPFRAVKFQQDVFFTVEAVKDHYRQPPNIKRLTYKVVPENSTRLAMLKTGEADIIQLFAGHIPQVEKNPKLRIVWSKYTQLRTLVFCDLDHPDKAKTTPFRKKKVRLAAAHAINKEVICKNVLRGSAEPWGMILAPYHPGYDPKVRPYAYDPKKAKALLAEAGYPNGFDTVLNTSVQFKLETQALASDLKKVGIRAKLNVLEHGTWVRMCIERKLVGLNNHPTPYWAGRNAASALTSTVGLKNPWAWGTTPELAQMLQDLNRATTKEDQARLANKLAMRYREVYNRANLWVKHIPWGIGPRVAYWENVMGWRPPAGFEYLRLNK